MIAAGASASDRDWPGAGKFKLYDTALEGNYHINANCQTVWGVLTQVDKLRELAPHLNITSHLKVAEKRGDYVNVAVTKPRGTARLKFVLLSPVPNHRVDAVLQPEGDGPWVRIQRWLLNPVNADQCNIGYFESYNEIWLKKQRIYGSNFIAENRDHHVHVILSRIKNMAEGRPAGDKKEYKYLFDDARTFPAQFAAK